MNSNNRNSCNTVFPRDIVCLRNVSISTLHKGDDDDDDDNNNKKLFKIKNGTSKNTHKYYNRHVSHKTPNPLHRHYPFVTKFFPEIKGVGR